MAKDLTPDLTDELWEAIRPHLPPRPRYNPKGGHPWCDDKAALRGILYLLREGALTHRFGDREPMVASRGCYQIPEAYHVRQDQQARPARTA